MTRDFLVEFQCAPGDIVAATAVLRDVLDTYPDVRIGFKTNHPHLTSNNRRLTPLVQLRTPQVVKLDYSLGQSMLKAGQYHEHFITWFHRQWTHETGLPVTCRKPKGWIVCNDPPLIEGDYWLLLGGGKSDITVKHWSFLRYEMLTAALRDEGIHVVQTGASGDIHPAAGADLDLTGFGALPEFVNQVAHSQGVICPITCAMHLAAVFDKPCVVIAGGREHVCWEAYTNEGQFGQDCEAVKTPHRFLHTIGRLDCCEEGGCWRRKLENTAADQRCLRPDRELFQIMPECMTMITVSDVLNAVLSYRTIARTRPRLRDGVNHGTRS
jgi:hypothetical protein